MNPVIKKALKAFVQDVLMGVAAGLATVQIVSIDDAIANQAVISFAVIKAVVQAAVRFLLKWSST